MTCAGGQVNRSAPYLAALCLASLLFGGNAGVADEAEISQRRRQQQLTVDAARQLIAEILDVQLEQFAENGLTSLPVYRDISQMRSNLDQVSEQEMRQIVELLGTAQRTTGPQQAESLQQARATARKVVAVLMAERDRLRQRLKVAHLQAQLKQLIDRQLAVRAETRRLPDLATDQRDTATLSALEGQRDTRTLFQQLLESLQTAGQWPNREGQAASDSAQQLREKQVEGLLTQTESNLAQGDFDGAEQHQSEILDQLASVLTALEAAQGLDRFDPSTALEKIRDLMGAQQRLADDTQEVDTSDPATWDSLSQRQHDIRQQLEELTVSDSGLPAAETLLQQAQAAAYRAEGQLFEGAREEAMDQQQDVLHKLDQLKSLLESTAPTDHQAMDSANEAAALVEQLEQLEQLDGALAELADEQHRIVENASTQPADAQQAQQQVASQLAEEGQRDPLPPTVRQSVQQAADEASQAAQTMQDHSPQAGSARHEAAQAAEKALQAARTETSAQLQAARSQQQQAGAQSLASQPLATQSLPQAPQATQTEAADKAGPASQSPSRDPAAKPGTPTRPADSERADPGAVAAHRTVADGQRSADDHAIAEGQSAADAPWFARLPAELREAIRSRGRSQPPRGYEERLRRYFESADK